MLGQQRPPGQFAEVNLALRGLRDTSCLQLSTPSAAGRCAARYSMHPLVAEIFRDEFGALSELHRRLVLQDFIRVVGRHDGHARDAARRWA